MIQTDLTPQALSILRKAGWNGTSRKIDVDLADLQAEGFETPPSNAISILNQYSGIEFEVTEKKFLSRSIITFGLEKALEIPCIKSDLEEHQIILGKKLYPIGSMDLFHANSDISYERMILLVAEDNTVYSSRSYVIVQEGRDVNDAINRIVSDELLWKTDETLRINYSRHDPMLRELRKKEAAC
jgi:SUKH-3 immunity protein